MVFSRFKFQKINSAM